MEQQNEMNNMEVTVENDQTAVAEVAEPTTGNPVAKVVIRIVKDLVIFAFGVATPFVVKKIKERRANKAAKTTVVDDEFEEMPDFGDAE